MKRLYKLPWKGLMSLDVTTAPTAAFRISAPRRRRADVVPRLAAGCGLGLVALAAGLAAGRAPLLAVTGALAAVLVGLALTRFAVGIGLLTISFFFDNYL